jgi:phosphate transport system permease protein
MKAANEMGWGRSSLSKKTVQAIGFTFIRLIALFTVLPILGIVVYIVIKGGSTITWEFLTTMPRDGMRAGGILPAIIGTFYLMLGTAAFSIPLGLAAGIYLSEYSDDNAFTRLLRIAIISLAGVPSVVYGLFGLGLFVLFFKFGISILSASLTLSIMTLPIIISTTEEAMRSVPYQFRIVGISLGGTQWQTIRKLVLPQALPGIVTGIILGLERAVGETAPILFTGATFFLPRLPSSPMDATMALPYHIFVISTQVPGMPIQIQYGTVLVLMVFVLGMNLIASLIRSRARARRQW